MAKILGVGTATLDIINHVNEFPAEDSEVRAISQSIRRGGNVTNTLVVLSQLGHQCTWAGTLADDPASEVIRTDLTHYAIDTSAVQVVKGGRAPTSYITLNQKNGSRTIVHFRDLAEYSSDAFHSLDLSQFDWLHFEGRNVSHTTAMLEYARDQAPAIPCSVEIEKPRDNIEDLFGLADLLIYSRQYAEFCGFSVPNEGPQAFLREMLERTPGASHICTWGISGAYGILKRVLGNVEAGTDEPKVFQSDAFIPAEVVDTLGAGDTFNAAIIHAWLQGLDFKTGLQEACRLAGRKCGQAGLANLV